MPTIIPIRDLKNTTEISEKCHKSSEPIFVTKNGYGDMVIMSMETYEELFGRLELYKELAISESQFSEGKTREAKAALADVRKKYGL